MPPPAQLPMHSRSSISSSKKPLSSSSSFSSNTGSANQTAAVADLGNALLASFLVPFAPSLLDRRLNVGFFHESDAPYWWALILLAFWGGQHSACWMRRRPGSWHWFMTRPPLRRATQVQLVCLVVLLMAVLSTGWATRVELLMISRWLTGFASVFLWGHAVERKKEGLRRGGAAAVGGGGGRWSNNRILVPSSSTSSFSGTVVSPFLNPMQALGWVLGGLVGGLSYSSRMFVVVGGLPAMVPSIIVAVLVFLLACLVLRKMRKEVEGVGGRKYYKQDQQQYEQQQQQQQQLGGGAGSGRDALTEAGMSLPSPGTAARRTNNHNNHLSTSSFPSTPSPPLPPSFPPPPPPPTFLQAAGGDYTKAHAHYHAHLRWRKEEGIEDILSQPHPTFEAIKKYYPHFVHGRGKKNEIVIYEYPGKMDLRELKKLGVGAEEIGRHYVYFNEFLYRRLARGREGEGGREDEDEGRVMTVLDIGGMGLGSLNKDVLEVLRTTSHLLHHHYPSRVVRIVVVNVPFFIGGVWKILASVLPQQVQEKIELSSNPQVDLLKYIDKENIPREYGGGSRVGLGESEEEMWLRELVREGGRTRTGGRAGGGKEGKEEEKASSLPRPARSALPPKISTTSTPSSSSKSSSNSSSSCSNSTTSWLPSWMSSTPSFLPLRKGPSPKHAHLGYENKFIFDKTRRVWVLREEEEGEEDEEEGEEEETLLLPGKKDEGGREEEGEEEEDVPPLPETEEDGLVLAIQAAHYAEQLSREGKKSPSSLHSSSSSSSVLLPRALQQQQPQQQQPQQQQQQQQTLSARVAWRENTAATAAAATAGAGTTSSLGAHTDADLELGSAASNPSPASSFSSSSSSSPSPLLLLQTTLLSLLLSLLQHSLLPMLPIWLALPHSIGGLSLPPSLLGLLLSVGTTATFLSHAYALPPSLLRLPSSNPLQAFRLAVIVFVSCTVLMSGLHPRMTSLPSSSSPSSSSSILAGFQHLVAGIFYLFILLLLVSSLSFARAASTTLVHLVFPPPSLPPVLPFLLSCTEVVGPVVGAWVLSWSVAAAGVGVRYPMDGRLLWHVSALILVGLYAMTLQLQVVLKGDWGAMRLEEGGGGGGGFVFLGKGGRKKGRKKKGRLLSGSDV